jgi:hypothetical protein
MPRASWIAISLLGLACASGAQPGGSAGPRVDALAYGMPETNPLTYLAADSLEISMEMAGMSVQVAALAESTLQLAFANAASGLTATLTFLTLSGQFTNSMGPSTTIGESDKPGPTTLTVSPRGEIRILQRPTMTAALQQILGSESMFQRMFTRLPGRAASPGEEWVDTMNVTDEAEGMTTTNQIVVRSTLAGDSTVGGRQLKLIRSEATIHTTMGGSVQGMEIRQRLEGTTTATSLWDAARGVLVERIEFQNSNGTMDMPSMNMTGIPVTARGKGILRLQSGT